MPGYRTGAVFVIALAVVAGLAPGGDAIADAKRKAAADLMREGKTTDAIAMIAEVIKADPGNYKDHLLLARAYDKLNQSQEAVDSYRRVLELPGGAEDRAVKVEVEKRLKVLDGQTAKIRAAEEDFLKKLDVLEREAISLRDMRAIEHIFRLKAGVWSSQNRRDVAGVEISANGEWQAMGLSVKAGATYHIRAAGKWMIEGAGPCTADGHLDLPPIVGGPPGILIAAVSGDLSKYKAIGSEGRFTATASGQLTFICNMPTQIARTKNSGKVFVVAQQE